MEPIIYSQSFDVVVCIRNQWWNNRGVGKRHTPSPSKNSMT